MKKQIIPWLAFVVVAVAAFLVYQSLNKVTPATVASDGSIKGEYSIASIMALRKPYVCHFERQDGTSQIRGTLYTDGQNLNGEFRIHTTALAKEFNSFLIVKGEDLYAWTSLAPIGYKSKVSTSAERNASPVEQSQIVGTKDKLPYECSPWATVDPSTFEVPTWVTFSNLK